MTVASGSSTGKGTTPRLLCAREPEILPKSFDRRRALLRQHDRARSIACRNRML
jgi:hypothetical protein